MVLPNFEYMVPKTIGEACNLLLELGKGAKVFAGATDIIPPMRDKAFTVDYLIDLKHIPGMKYIEYDETEGLKIGALTTLREIETSPLVKEKNPAVAHAAKVVASTQIRAKGTMAGNLCNASPSADTPPILLAQNAKVLVQGPNKDRYIMMDDFFVGFKKTALEPGEIVTGCVIPPLKEGESAAYIKHAVRKAMDLAIIGVAVKLTMDGDVCKDARIALGAVAPTIMRARNAEKALIGKKLTDDVIVEASLAARDECSPISDIRASAEYRRDMIRVFTKRAIKQALEG
ncbi:MAG: xanthine dehydrogenase family protein subunit M [Clostridiales bacterium]|nr:xanthine dehydrogenase family protein subunit M [Clostridiales bacterium]MDY5515914.1 xanthine dehydrogenase family protein subunit M [Candidatus Ventricola sp.]